MRQDSYEVTTEDRVQPKNQPPAQISLTDCLACSGCVTSAEAVLISLQSHAEVLNTLDAHPEIKFSENASKTAVVGDGIPEEGKIFVASVSPQVRASLAATYGISQREAAFMIDQLLSGPCGLRSGGKHGSGFTWVIDTNVMRDAILVLTADEVEECLSSPETATDGRSFCPPKRPILSSACPGWICYAEKTHPFLLPHLSRLKSPQALAGTFFKTVLSKKLGVLPSQIWHLAVMPCFDKKLEASRQELTDVAWRSESHHAVRDVDCVITSRELLMLASSRQIPLSSLPLAPLNSDYAPRFPDKALDLFLFSRGLSNRQPSAAGTSGGYLYHVLMTFQSRHPNSQIVTQRGRNSDVVEYSLISETGQAILRASRYYGFRNIQNLVRKLKPAQASRLAGTRGARRAAPSRLAGGPVSSLGNGGDIAYVEVMACPGGCTNGGGQIRAEDARQATMMSGPSATSDGAAAKPSPQEQRALLARVDEAYFSAESDSDVDSEDQTKAAALSLIEKDRQIHQILKYWSNLMEVPVSKLVYTTYRQVDSDVGKKDSSTDTARVVELAGKIGGGW